jgi:hypothetical protein
MPLAGISLFASTGMSLLDAKNMKTARMGHYTALLPDGRAILFGGHGTSFVALATSEIYSPASDSFTLHTMNDTRDAPALTRLANGKYLLAGGAADLGVAPGNRSAELFNPADNSFTQISGQLTYGRMTSCAATLSSGKALIVGGWYNSQSPAYPELFDTASGTFALTKPLNTPRAWPLVVPTADGKALVFGGIGGYGATIHEQIELFNPADSSFSIVGNSLFGPSDTGWSSGALSSYNRTLDQQKLKNGKYLFFATNRSRYALFTVDPSTKEFTRITTQPIDFIDTSLSILAPLVDTLHDWVYIIGEKWETSRVRICCYIVDLDDWNVYQPTSLDSLPVSYFLSSVGFNVMKNGRILMSGGHSQTGYNTNFSPINSAQWIIPDTISESTGIRNAENSLAGFSKKGKITFTDRMLTIQCNVNDPVTVDLFNAAGKQVDNLFNGIMKTATIRISLKSRRLTPGVYFCSVKGRKNVETIKLSLW